MRKFELTILGSNSALPAYGRFPTSQVLNINEDLLLIDCGEGTQIRMSQYRIKRNKISRIFISHLHGDHLYGLPGVITSFYHTSRTQSLQIFGPTGIKRFLDTVFEVSGALAEYPLEIIELEDRGIKQIIDAVDYEIFAFPVSHRMPTFGYLFREKFGERNIRKSSIEKYRLNIDQIKAAKAGEEIRINDKIIDNSEITHPNPVPRSYAYCADSRYDESLLEYIEGVNTLYFETTYLDDMIDQAIERGHCTARQAGRLARKAGVQTLITGHYSSRYKNLEPILAEAKTEFENVVLGTDGLIFQIK